MPNTSGDLHVENERGGGSFVNAPNITSESLFAILWRGRWFVLLAAVIALIAGFIFVQKATPLFKSSSSLYVERSGPRIINDLEDGVMTRGSNYLSTQVEVMKSTPILQDAVDVSGLGQLQTFQGIDNKVAYLKRALSIAVGKKDDIIRVEMASPYPSDAAKIVNAVVDAYKTERGTRKRSTSAEVLKILQKEIDKRNKEVASSFRAMITYKKEHETLAFETEDGGNIIIDMLQSLSQDVSKAEFDAIDTNEGGMIVFQEFTNWAFSKNFDLEDDIDSHADEDEDGGDD